MEDIHQILDAIQQTKQNCVLGTIIQVEGSAYRKEGASMLFLEDGTHIGMLSAGCLEVDLAERAKRVLAKGQDQIVDYDMRAEDDLSWGQGAGCNGRIRVLLEPVCQQFRNDLCTVRDFLKQGKRVAIGKMLTSDCLPVNYLFMTDDRETVGRLHDSPDHDLHRILSSYLGKEPKRGIIHSRESGSPVFYQTYLPRQRLILFGAGPDAKPLAAMAALMGYEVVIADWRPSFCNPAHFPQAVEFCVGRAEELVSKIRFTPYDAAVVMTHHFQRDHELLPLLLEQNVRYLGILGPKARTVRLLNKQEIPPRLHSPVGLPIGADGPMEIAVSILAEIIATKRTPYAKQDDLT